MVKLFLFIVTCCFVLQSGGSVVSEKKIFFKTEQCIDDTNTGEKDNKLPVEKDKDQLQYFQTTFFIFHTRYPKIKILQSFPKGFYSKSYTPPR